MADHAPGSGVHVQEAACCGVSVGGLLVLETHLGSMGPICIRSPLEKARTGLDLSAKEISICQEVAAVSRHKNMGGVMPGGKMEPFSG